MKLLQPSISDRAFLVQYNDAHAEFGAKIPWMRDTQGLGYILDEKEFKHSLFEALGLERDEDFTPYILATGGRRNEYIGGMRSFSRSPEVFLDPRNEAIRMDLESSLLGYITCLQIRESMRGSNRGKELFRRAMKEILNRFGSVWGVVSDLELLSYYISFGAEVENYEQNTDGVRIISFQDSKCKI